MSERSTNRASGILALVVGLALLGLAMTSVPGALAALPVGAVFVLIGIALVWPRRTQG